MKKVGFNKDLIRIKGFTRLQRVDRKTKKIISDTGWLQNQITNYGMNNCLCAAPIGAASVQAAGFVLGTGGDPASSATALEGSNSDQYSAFGQSSVIASLMARLTGSFAGSNGSMATLGNIGILAASNGSLIAGKSFPTSSLGADQDINASYEFRYSRS